MSPSTLPRWSWSHEGEHSVELDLEGGDLVWWDEYTPRGDNGDSSFQAIEAFLATDRGGCWLPPPAEIFAKLRAALAKGAPALADRPAQDRLVAAARQGDVAALTRLIRGGCPLDQLDCRGRVALWSALANARAEAALELIRRGASVRGAPPPGWSRDLPHSSHRTLLEVALERRLFEVAAALVEAGAPVSHPGEYRPACVWALLIGAPLELVDALIARGSPFDPHSFDARRAMQFASAKLRGLPGFPGDAESVVRWLAAAGVAAEKA